MQVIKSTTRNLVFLFAAFDSTRMLSGAIHSLYLLKEGVPLETLAFLQVLYSGTILLLEIPIAGLVIYLGSKWSVIVGLLSWTIYFLGCLLAPHLLSLSIGIIIYALGACLIVGSTETWLLNSILYHYPNQENKIYYYQHLKEEYFSLLTITMGAAGALLSYIMYPYYRLNYLVSALLLLATIFLLMQQFYKKPSRNELNFLIDKNLFENLKFYLTPILRLRNYRFYLIISILLTVIYQLVYHYWQPFLIELINKNNLTLEKDIPFYMGISFVSYCFAKYISHKLIKNYQQKNHSFLIVFIATLIATISMTLLVIGVCLTEKYIILLFSLFHAGLSIMLTESRAYFIQNTKTKILPLVFSSVSVIARLFSIGFLLIICGLLKNFSIVKIFKLTPWLCIFIITFLLLWHVPHLHSIQLRNKK